MIVVYVTAGLLACYCILILFYRAGWNELDLFEPDGFTPKIKISVIVAARNEEHNLGSLLTSISEQNYPKELYEVILVDDNSTDNTVTIANNYPFVEVIQLRFDNINSYKKKAIETGIAAATGELIVTTDADCVAPPDWLKTIAAFKEQTQAAFIPAPVFMQYKKTTILQIFQSLDFMVLQGITAASVKKRIHNMCNGANLAYEKKVFLDVNGFSDIDHIASGDDMLFMQKIANRFPGKIAYLLSKKTIVTTETATTWNEFFNQRIRWASKATHYNDIKIFSALLLVYLFNCALFTLFIIGFWNAFIWMFLLSALALKTIIELFFLYPVARFYNQAKILILFPFFQPLHIVYTIIAGMFGAFVSFEWKGRRVK